MTERGKELHATADAQLGELIGLMSTLDEAALRLPCPGREKLGDGTVAACARHTADNYQRIATFVQTSHHAEPALGAGQHADQYAADTIDLNAVVGQLSASRDTIGRIVELTDSQLDAIPPKDRFRFCDGRRTLEQVLAGLLTHQSHQIDALKTALA